MGRKTLSAAKASDTRRLFEFLTAPSGDRFEGIWLLDSGSVRLSRDIDGVPTVFHSHSVGRILGLLSLSVGGTYWYDCVAESEITVAKLRLNQLYRALRREPTLWLHFFSVLLRSHGRRGRRALELQMEVNELNKTLCSERDQLALTVSTLQETQIALVEREKMVLLGQLVAGVAHELNNPAAALRRAADFITEDAVAILASHPDGSVAKRYIERGLEKHTVVNTGDACPAACLGQKGWRPAACQAAR